MKKILIVTDNLPDQINGVVTTYKNLESCAVLDGYSVYFIDPGRYKHVDCPRYSEVKLSVASPKMVGKTIEEISPDHIHIATEGPLGMCARRYCTLRDYRYTSAYHTKFPEGLKKILGVPEKVSWPVMRWFHSESYRILTTTISMVRELRKHGFDSRKLVVWTRGVDRDIFYPDVRTKKSPVKHLVCVSRVSKEKNLKAFFELECNYKTKKTMVGDGPMLEHYKQKYPDVEFVGFKKGEELADYYRSADCFVFPSRWDTFGIVMIEAMACGTPVAAYPVTGPIDVVEPGVTGYLCENLGEAVNQVIHYDRDTVAIGSRRFSWQACWEIFKENLVDKTA